MNRRQFLASLPALALLPSSLTYALTGCTPSSDQPSMLQAALKRAFAAGKPLLVLLAPNAVEPGALIPLNLPLGAMVDEAGDLFGFGGESLWLALSMCEVYVATRAAFEHLAKDVIAKEPLGPTTWAVLVDPQPLGDGKKLSFQRLRAELGPKPPTAAEAHDAKPDLVALHLRQYVAPRAAECVHALRGNQNTVERYAGFAQASLKEEELQAGWNVGALPADAPPLDPTSLRSVDRCAAVLMKRFPDSEPLRKRLIAAARARLWEHAPEGAVWELLGPCAGEILDHPDADWGIDCGMANMPDPARRFLIHYVPAQTAQETR